MRRMIALARDRVFPALVNIHVITVNYWNGKEQKGNSVGSGTIISTDGHVLTNCHVTLNGKKFKCILSDKQEISATLVGEDPLTDLAVLKLNLEDLKDRSKPIPRAEFGDSDELQIGDTVMAMGSPLALARSVTLGIVSNTERMLAGGMDNDEPGELFLQRGQRTGLFNRWIQHDAAINPGNSGGPLVNLKGLVVGVNTRGGSMGGDMGFAIPSNVARSVAAAIIEHGQVLRSYYGMSLRPIQRTGLTRGVLVNSVLQAGPAAQAGLKAGDLIVAVNGQPVTVRFSEEVPPLLRMLAEQPIGGTVRLTYERDGKEATIEVVTERMQKERGDEAAFRAWGITAEELTESLAREMRLDHHDGVIITSVRPGSAAQVAEPPLDENDVIRTIDGEAIQDLDAFVATYDRIMSLEKLPEYLLIGFERRGQNQVTLLKPKPDKDDDPPREVAKAWIGVATQPVLKTLAEKLGLGEQLGFRVTRVYPGTLAEQSGLKVGDVIVSLNSDKLRPRGMQDAGLFQRNVRKLTIDNEATLSIIRDKSPTELRVKLERTRLTQEEARRDKNRDFELNIRELTFFDRDENRWPEDVQGVIVESAESAGWAGLGGIRAGDLIQRIDQNAITGLEDYRKAMEQVAKAQPERVVFVVLRGTQSRFQYVEPDWRPETKVDEKKGDERKDAGK
ncbi:MAG: PDZ domain-containing protein [Phycisphaerae bacterium]